MTRDVSSIGSRWYFEALAQQLKSYTVNSGGVRALRIRSTRWFWWTSKVRASSMVGAGRRDRANDFVARREPSVGAGPMLGTARFVTLAGRAVGAFEGDGEHLVIGD